MSLKSPKNTKKRKKKVLLETSVLIRRLSDLGLKNALERIKLQEKKEFTTSFFVRYEFKVSLILNLIHFYFAIEKASNFPNSVSHYSNKFGRHVGSALNIIGLMMEDGDVPSDKDRFLLRLEAKIHSLITNFETDIEKYVGFFSEDEISSFEIKTQDDFIKFAEAYKNRKFIPMKSFWEVNIEKIDRLLDETSDYQSKPLKKILENLLKLRSDLGKGDTHQVSKALGDPVIAVDCPEDYELITIDHAFDTLCPKVGTRHINMKDKLTNPY